MPRITLGISAWFHDSAAAIIIDGAVVAAAEEERFSRIKHDANFPTEAIRFCLQQANINLTDVDAIAFYEKPFLKFERILESFYQTAPFSIRSFVTAMPNWFGEKLFAKSRIHKALKAIDDRYDKKTTLIFPEHHLSHAASAFYPSGWDEAAILTVDGVGEWATATIGVGSGSDIRIIKELHFPHSVGLLYSAFTQFLGFKVNSGEYKLMGLSAYGEPEHADTERFKYIITNELVTIFPDGSIELQLANFGFLTSLSTIKKKRWEKLFGMPVRKADEAFTLQHANLALAIQQVVEDIMLKLATEAKRLTGASRLCMAGGVALNCVANGVLERAEIFDEIYIQPAAGDSGGALGAAMAASRIVNKEQQTQSLPLPLFGPAIEVEAVEALIAEYSLPAKQYDASALAHKVADLLAEGKIIGLCRGRMEFGPRALGNRSIVADPRVAGMQEAINRRIKNRESYRPFAPAILEEEAHRFFDLKAPSPHMLMVYPLKNEWRSMEQADVEGLSVLEKLKAVKSQFPAITHADFSSRIQTVSAETHPLFHALIKAFYSQTDCPMLLNTSFNERGEPIVATARDTFYAFMRTGLDVLVLGEYLIEKKDLTHLDKKDFEREFEKD